MDWIDETERSLIIKFFGVDPVDIVHPDKSRYLGSSNFKNIIDFYRFEYKEHEKEFWDKVDPIVAKLPDKTMVLEMSKVDVGYPWLDYVTVVDIQYKVEDNRLVIIVDRDIDPHKDILKLICTMMFVSDFNDVKPEYKDVCTEDAWNYIMRLADE